MATRTILYWAVVFSLLSASLVNLVWVGDRDGSAFSFLAGGLALLLMFIGGPGR